MKKIFYIFSLVFINLFFINIGITSAAEFFFNSNLENEYIKVDLFIDTQGESINTISAKINYDNSKLRLEKITKGNSLINAWVDDPSLKHSSGNITFSGIIPGGVSVPNGFILSLYFSSLGDKKNIKEEINIVEGIAYLNQDKTKVVSVNQKSNVIKAKIPEDKNYKYDNFVVDRIPPEDFKVLFSRSAEIFNSRHYIVFNPVDKGSGIKSYELSESKWDLPYKKIADWEDVKSPYLLKDQSLKSYIFIKVTDNEGNIRFKRIEPQNKDNFYFYLKVFLYLFAIVLFIWVLIVYTAGKRIKK